MILEMRLEGQEYPIHIASGTLKSIGKTWNLDRRVLVVSDTGVPSAYAEMVADQSRNPVLAVFPEGEASKNLDRFRELLGQMLKHSFTRSDCVVAVGGGVVGDLAGFAAACYMRGIDFYNVPTTLLAQVDSSIGGKTAVDLDGVKNVVGAFHQPKGVAVDPEVLRTLSERQLHAGLAEAIKMAATSDADLFARIEASSSLENDLESIICSALQIKQSVVEQDPEEHGLRRVLNFGHTIGHAIESAEGGALLHGECVAAGMIPMCGEDCRERLRNVLKKYDLPTGTGRSREELLPYLIHDKKQESDRIRVVCVDRIGSFRFDSMTPEQILDWMEY